MLFDFPSNPSNNLHNYVFPFFHSICFNLHYSNKRPSSFSICKNFTDRQRLKVTATNSIMAFLLDLIYLAIIGAIGYFTYYKFFSPSPQPNTLVSTASLTSVGSTTSLTKVTDRSFIDRMKTEDRNVLIMFGSQSGTAEELAGRLSKDLMQYGQKPLVVNPEDMDVEDLPKIKEIKNPLLLLCVATYGEGDPTDNTKLFHQYLKSNDPDFTGLQYAVFGLGNKTYKHYNFMGKYFDERFQKLGAERVFELGLGDDDGNLEEDFMKWREAFLPAIAKKFGWEVNNNGGIAREYRLEIVEKTSKNVYTGEFRRIGAYRHQKPPYDQKNPYLSKILVHKELHASASERSCRHIEFNIEGSKIRYEAGDHLAVFPTNDSEMVEKLGKLVSTDINLDTVFKLVNLDKDSAKRYPFPCPCTFRTALTHYVDISAPVKSHVLKALAEFTSDEKEKERLKFLSTASADGLREYSQFIGKERRNIINILEHFTTCKPPVDLLLELLPRLQPRYYSISSSPKINSNLVSITVILTKYTIGDRLIKGVCTHYLSQLKLGDTTPIFVRKSTFRLPSRPEYPLIMIGPGTGFAPFRGFLQERSWQKSQGKEIGPIVLFYGCRHPEHDYIYQEEILKFKSDNIITDLQIAFSRAQDTKVYVQDLIWKNRERLWDLIKQNANIYVCGDARNMARDVQKTFLKIFEELGGMKLEAAQEFFKNLEQQRRYQADVWS